jgi:putative transposase
MPFRNAPRARSFDYVGAYLYFLTICTDGRRRCFVARADIEGPLSQLLRTADEEGFATSAYCFMPDHLHLLVEGKTQHADLRRFARRYKQQSGYSWKQMHGRQLWQRGYYDHVLREDEEAREVARYILHNPVRAGLCTDPLAYELQGSATLEPRDLLASTSVSGWRA